MILDDFLEKYGDIEVCFTSYYKYSFSFRGTKDGVAVYLRVGGDASDIYGLDIEANKAYKVSELDFNYGNVTIGEVVIDEYSPW